MAKQRDNETNIFTRFAMLCPYKIDLDSIEQRDPPEPDISCNLSNGNTIAFELVESIDESLAKSFYDAFNLKQAFMDALEKMPIEKSILFNSNFQNASFYISFALGLTARKKNGLIPTILDHLLALEKTYEGTIDIHHILELNKTVRNIVVSRGRYVGPLFEIAAGGSFGEPCLYRVREKFNKKYKEVSDMELLVYFELQPGIPLDHWLPQVEKFIRENIRETKFKRVWIYSVSKNKLIYIYPKI